MIYSVIVCVYHVVIPAMSYVKKSFSINSVGLDESDIDVSLVTYLYKSYFIFSLSIPLP